MSRKIVFLTLAILSYAIGIVFFPDFLLGEEMLEILNRKLLAVYLIPAICIFPPLIIFAQFTIAIISDISKLHEGGILLYTEVVALILIGIILVIIDKYFIFQSSSLFATAFFLVMYIKESNNEKKISK